ASPYLAKELCRLLTEAGLVLMERKDFDPYLAADKLFLTCSRQEQERLLAQDSTYGHLICRCEKITEGDIRRVLAQSLPPHNLNGLKKRLRLGMGVCQGSFCTPRIIEILSRELNIPPEKVLKGEKGSNLVKGKVK
ncbi:MAG: (2Fe-2S)-binding protein, partial [Clostridiales bacterium]